jgi:hypothetical protein
MRKTSTLLLIAAAVSLLAGAFAYGQGRDRHSPEPYRAVVTVPVTMGTRTAKSKIHEMPELTEALNELEAEGYTAQSISPFTDNRFVVVARKR